MGLRRVAWAYGSNLMGVFSSLLTNLWVMRAVAAETGKDELGLFFAFATFVSYLQLLQAGMDFAVSQISVLATPSIASSTGRPHAM